MSESSKTGKDFETNVENFHRHYSFKTAEFGRILAEKFIEVGLPSAVREACDYLLRVGNGYAPLPCHAAPDVFHHCRPNKA